MSVPDMGTMVGTVRVVFVVVSMGVVSARDDRGFVFRCWRLIMPFEDVETEFETSAALGGSAADSASRTLLSSSNTKKGTLAHVVYMLF